jgi:hypothetical protein
MGIDSSWVSTASTAGTHQSEHICVSLPTMLKRFGWGKRRTFNAAVQRLR